MQCGSICWRLTNDNQFFARFRYASQKATQPNNLENWNLYIIDLFNIRTQKNGNQLKVMPYG